MQPAWNGPSADRIESRPTRLADVMSGAAVPNATYYLYPASASVPLVAWNAALTRDGQEYMRGHFRLSHWILIRHYTGTPAPPAAAGRIPLHIDGKRALSPAAMQIYLKEAVRSALERIPQRLQK